MPATTEFSVHLNQRELVLWIYIALLEMGGMIGFIKARSKISLIMSTIFAVPLALCALEIIKPFYVSEILIGILVVVFAIRFAKGKKFMPGGLMLSLSIAADAVLLLLR